MKTIVSIAAAIMFSAASLCATASTSITNQPSGLAKGKSTVRNPHKCAYCKTGTSSSKSATDSTVPKKAKHGVKTLYTCSMHPEVISDKPGKCPKCGMNLIKKEVKKGSDKKEPMRM